MDCRKSYVFLHKGIRFSDKWVQASKMIAPLAGRVQMKIIALQNFSVTRKGTLPGHLGPTRPGAWLSLACSGFRTTDRLVAEVL